MRKGKIRGPDPVIEWRAMCPVLFAAARGDLEVLEVRMPISGVGYVVKLSLGGREVAAFVNESGLAAWCESVLERIKKADRGG